METTKAITIQIKEFDEYTGPRYFKQGDSSGEEFYHNILNEKFAEAYKSDMKLIVDLDNTAGYLSSFLDEAFGNLVYDFGAIEVKKRLKIISLEEPDWEDMIMNDVINDWEGRRMSSIQPTITKVHESWYRLDDNKLVEHIWIAFY